MRKLAGRRVCADDPAMRFDLTDLRLFLHVAEAESITRGAERAGLALASASERIRGMELAGGVPLLERHPRGVRPTPAGLAVVHHARLMLGQLEQMRGELGQYARGLRGHVRLLSITAAAAASLPEALSGFLAAYPTIDIDLEERTSREAVDALAGGLADLGIVADTTDLGALETLPLYLDRIVLVVPQEHALTERSAVAFREVLDEPLVGLSHSRSLQAYLATHAARAGRPFKLRVRLNGLDSVCRMVERGVGVAIVPEAVARRAAETLAIRAIPIDEPWALRRLRLCTRSFAALTPHARHLAQHLAEHLGAEPS